MHYSSHGCFYLTHSVDDALVNWQPMQFTPGGCYMITRTETPHKAISTKHTTY